MKRLLVFISIMAFVTLGLKAQSNIKIALNNTQQNGKFAALLQKKSSNAKQSVPVIYYMKNKKQVNAIQQAFQKDRSKASMIMQGKNKEKNSFETLIFKSDKVQKIYTLELIDKANAKITYILNDIKNSDRQISEFTKSKNNSIRYYIPKNGYMNVNGKRMTVEQARKEGYNVEYISK